MNLEHPWYMLVPILAVLGAFFIKKNSPQYNDLSKIADQHLLKYLVNIPIKQNYYKYLMMFGMVFLFSLALANPRWGEREYQLYNGNSAAVIILDVSSHMGCQDVKPTRSVRARQIAGEIVKSFKQVNFGVLAFAKNTHLIAPITEDQATLHNYLPSIDYSLIYQQGQELDSSLELAAEMLAKEATQKKSIILLSSGNFNVHNFKTKYPVYVIGIGTEQGGPMYDRENQHIYSNGQLQITKLAVHNLQKLATSSGGRYFSYLDIQRNVQILQEYLTSNSVQNAAKNTVKTWNDGYAYVLILAVLLVVFSLRRGVIMLSLAVIMFVPMGEAEATPLADFFKNSEQRASEAVERLDFASAAELFSDPYNQGVSWYKAKKYEQAVLAFKKNKRANVNLDALYNLGNSYYMLENYKEAIASYEQVLKLDADHADAKFNLELARKKLKEKEEQDCECPNKKPSENGQDGQESKQEKDAEQNSAPKDEQGSTDKNAAQEQLAQDAKDAQDKEQAAAQENNSSALDEPKNEPMTAENAADNSADSSPDLQQHAVEQEAALDEQQQKWLQRINSDISNFLKTRMYIDDLKSNK